ncbi:hypothetical protein EK0264_03670 [Epidermidibacterium keratini]|uniref:Uncharacterized protein n=1 Tax=Epidermidibacterium keratini TaxID=1891644 RepID=A0A7L4YKW2_9ACTN|nr:hypothetical protein [Epidermidibacterium keratini]QHB99468.1 hypothetical protein EK0264_03670 [Epidermidibacterium keratini]
MTEKTERILRATAKIALWVAVAVVMYFVIGWLQDRMGKDQYEAMFVALLLVLLLRSDDTARRAQRQVANLQRALARTKERQ